MNIVKKMAIAVAVCAAVASAQDIKFGARVGYSIQSADGGELYTAMDALSGSKTDISMGLFGIGAAVVVNIPVGPVVIAPEVGFLTRTVYNYESSPIIPIPGEEADKGKMTEMAVNIPIMIKFFPIEGLYVAAGFQIGIPIGSEECDDNGDDCTKLDGKSEDIGGVSIPNPERNLDLGIPLGVGYMVTPNLGVDFRFVLGLSKVIKYKLDTGIPGVPTIDAESGKMNTFGLGVTYYF